MGGRWPQVRGALVALAIVVGLVDGCPLPHRPRPWQQPIVDVLRPAQQAVLRPFAWIGERMRVYQRWALYQAPVADRYRLWVEGATAPSAEGGSHPSGAGAAGSSGEGAPAPGDWQILFRAGDDAHQDDAARIDYTRPRGVWDPTREVPPQYPLFADWLLERVLARHPELQAARVRLERVRLGPSGMEPTGEFLETRVRDRARIVPVEER